MLSPRRFAQLGLVSAVVLGGACLALIAAGAAEDRRLMTAQPGRAAPDFELANAMDPAHSPVRLSELRGSVVVAYFSSIRCPVSNQYEERIAQLAERYGQSGRVKFVAIHSGADAQSPAEVAVQSSVARLNFPQLLDVDGSVAAAYAATQTPTFVVIDRSGDVRYRGALDDSRTIDRVTQRYLENAIADVLAGRTVRQQSSEVEGCAIR